MPNAFSRAHCKSTRSRWSTHSLCVAALGATVSFGAFGCDDDDKKQPNLDVETAELQRALEAFVADEMAEAQVPGLGITVGLADGRVLQVSGGKVGPHADDARYDVDSTAQIIGSTTKLFTGAMIMQLVESGALALDQTIDRWFSMPGAARITVRMLLSHTSGLHDYTSFLSEEETARPWTPRQLVDRAVEQGAWGPPGAAVARYSNTNFTLLAMILEQETNLTWEQNVQTRIAQPLGLTHTFSATNAGANQQVVPGWVHTDDGWVDGRSATDPSIGWGVGALVSTNRELFTFTKALFGGELFESQRTVEQMLAFDTPVDPALLSEDEPPYDVGLCVVRYEIDGLQLEGHVGHILGYNSATFRDPQERTFVTVTSNVEHEVAGLTAVKVAQYLRAR